MPRLSPRIPSRLLQQIIAQAQAAPDVEICGLVIAHEEQPARLVPIHNIAATPATRFEMDPTELIDTFRQMREQGETLYAIYHSHPQGPAEPSGTDLAEVAYPEALYLIVSVREEGPRIRGYRLVAGQFAEQVI